MADAATPTVAGTFSKTPFAHVLVYIYQRKISGTLQINHGDHDDRIWFEKGVPSAGFFHPVPASMEEGLVDLFEKSHASFVFHQDAYAFNSAAQFGEAVQPLVLINSVLRTRGNDKNVRKVMASFHNKVLAVRSKTNLAEFGFTEPEIGFVHKLQKRPFLISHLNASDELSMDRIYGILYLLGITKGLSATRVSGASNAAANVNPDTSVVIMPPSADDTKGGRSGAPQRKRDSDRPTNAQMPRVMMAISVPEPPANLPKAVVEKWREIKSFYENMDEMTHYELLGLDMSAAGPEVSKAYMREAKRWHPDRLPDELSPLRSYVKDIFKRITDAQKVLSDDQERAEYLELCKEGAGSPAAQKRMMALVEGASLAQTAHFLIQQNDFKQALIHAEKAIALAPDDADANTAWAWAKYKCGGSSDDAVQQQVIEALEHALTQHSTNERAHFYLGHILKLQGQGDAALKHFKQALEANPRNVDAAREVRVAQVRRSQLPPSSANRHSLFAKLLKK